MSASHITTRLYIHTIPCNHIPQSCLTGQRTRTYTFFCSPQLQGTASLSYIIDHHLICVNPPPTDRPLQNTTYQTINTYYRAHLTNMPSSPTASASPSASTAPRPSNPSHSRACPTPSSPRMTSAGKSWTPPTSRPRPST